MDKEEFLPLSEGVRREEGIAHRLGEQTVAEILHLKMGEILIMN